jgi:N-acylneuraminate cytidylyltransferase
LEHLKSKEQYAADILVFLQCTAPFTEAKDIDGTIATMINEKADTALAVAPFHYFLWKKDTDGSAVGINHDKRLRLPRQEISPQYVEAGSVYVMDAKKFLHHKHRFFGKTVLFEIPPSRCFEIDDPIDLEIARQLFKTKQYGDRLNKLPSRIDAIVFDFDGVFTDNNVIVSQNGEESVICNRGDGMGITHLKQLNIPLFVLSKEVNPVVEARCKKLDIPFTQGVDNKLEFLTSWIVEQKYHADNIIYVGNDVNDLECLNTVGCGVVVNDSHPDVVPSADLVLCKNGGKGAIRELCDLIINRLKHG